MIEDIGEHTNAIGDKLELVGGSKTHTILVILMVRVKQIVWRKAFITETSN